MEKFKPIDELMEDFREAAKDIPCAHQAHYILGMLQVAYKMLYLDYESKIKRKKNQ